ncbi:hypothetical protein H6G93_09325 [Nostoc sp. FACHB-973]|nr:hypothetical protein [Nostoc sp. FACHB-973]
MSVKRLKPKRTVTISDRAWNELRAIADANGLSISALLECIGQGFITLNL